MVKPLLRMVGCLVFLIYRLVEFSGITINSVPRYDAQSPVVRVPIGRAWPHKFPSVFMVWEIAHCDPITHKAPVVIHRLDCQPAHLTVTVGCLLAYVRDFLQQMQNIAPLVCDAISHHPIAKSHDAGEVPVFVFSVRSVRGPIHNLRPIYS